MTKNSQLKRISFFSVGLATASLICSGCVQINNVSDVGNFMPHGYCLRWDPILVSTMVIANLGIAVAYFAIPAALWYFVRRKKDLPYPWMFRLFGMFIIACGITHVMKVWTLYQPFYWAEVLADAYTAIVSLLTALLLWPLIPQALALRSPKELEEVNEKLREQANLLNLTHDAVIVRDLDGTIRYWNLGAGDMYGFAEAEAKGQISHSLLNTKFPQAPIEIEEQILNKGYWEGELVHQTQDGRRIITSSRQILKIDSDNKASGVLEINTDITVHKQAEQRQAALAEVKRVNIDLEQFASVASHDLQEPLRAVAGCLQILQKTYKGKLDDNADELINHAVEGAVRMRTLINDLLSLSRVSSGDITLEPTDLLVALEQASKNMEITINERRAVITHDPLPAITAEKTQLVQLFQNLISNAIKFCSDKPPEIHISATRLNSHWQICISDNGIGFEKEHAEKIFQPFKRLHGREKYPGTGIGLAICKRIVEKHGGTIWAESNLGQGAKFCFTLLDIEK